MNSLFPLEGFLANLTARGIELWYEGERLRFHAPEGLLGAEERAQILSQQSDIIVALRAAAGERSEEAPLSFPQFAMWFQHQQAPASAVCTSAFVLQATGPLNVSALRHAIQALVDRHPMLRTTYHLCDEALVQRIAGEARAVIELQPYAAPDAAACDAPEAAACDAFTARFSTHIARPFDLQTGPVFRSVLFTNGAAEHAVLLCFHHIAADGWSSQIMMSELLSLYGEAAENRPPGLARPAANYCDFMRWQAAEVNGARGERQWSYWQRVLAAPRQCSLLPTDAVRPAVARFIGASVRSELSADLVQRVHGLAARLGTTPFVVLFGAFQLLLGRLCGVRDVVTGMPALGRSKAEYMSVVGNFINVLPVRSRLEEAVSVSDFLAQLRATVVAALEAQDYPLSRMVQRLHLSGDETGQALFNTSFTLLTPGIAGTAAGRDVGGVVFMTQPLALQAGLIDLGMDVVAGEAGMHCILKYSLDAMTAAAAADIARQYAAMIDAITDTPHPALCELLGITANTTSDESRADSLLRSLSARSITLTVDGERLRVNAPKGVLDETDRRTISSLRPAIIARLQAVAAAAAAREFWRGEIAGLPALLALPTDRVRADRLHESRPRLTVLVREMPGLLLESLSGVGGTQNGGLFITLMAAWQVLLHRYCGQDDVVVATASLTASASGGPGEVIPIRGRLEGNPTFIGFLEQIRGTVLAVEAHRAPPELGCQSRFDLRAVAVAAPPGTDAHDDALELGLELTTLSATGEPGPAQSRYRYAADLFDEETILRLDENFRTLLQAIAADPGAAVLELGLLGPAEQRRVRHDSGADAETSYDRRRCLHQLLEERARLHPERIAVAGVGGDLRYDTLDGQANQLAQFLLRSGSLRGAVIAVCLERTVQIPVALAAVLKAGGAYLPLDPAHPRKRLRGILRDSQAAFLITHGGLSDIAEDTTARLIRLDGDAAAIGACSGQSPRVAVEPDDLAYVIYTSGSTGRPKGVEIEHRNVVAFLEAMRRRPGFSARDVLLAVTTLAFDIAGLEIWLPLSIGARIVLATRGDAVDGLRLAALLDAQAVSVMQATPATWRLLLDSGWAGRPELRALCGGEALPQELAARLIGRVGELWNLYGPTETTIWSTAARVDAASVMDSTASITIGRPIANTVVRIEDRVGGTVPVGVVGELLIGGEGVARGYRNQPDLTAHAFVTRSAAGVTSRLYRTGDLARFRADGQLEYLGRRDLQIKLRGHRIELGEIEALLGRQAGVTGSAVIAQATTPEDVRLVAYVTLATGAILDPNALRTALRVHLPDYMVPGHFVALPAFPLTLNGKVDRRALPPPGEMHAETGAELDLPIPAVPMTPAQHRVAMLWRDVLRVGRVGLNDNFFDIGGHSLLLVKIHAGLKREFGYDMPLVELFRHTTVAQQARALEGSSHG